MRNWRLTKILNPTFTALDDQFLNFSPNFIFCVDLSQESTFHQNHEESTFLRQRIFVNGFMCNFMNDEFETSLDALLTVISKLDYRKRFFFGDNEICIQKIKFNCLHYLAVLLLTKNLLFFWCAKVKVERKWRKPKKMKTSHKTHYTFDSVMLLCYSEFFPLTFIYILGVQFTTFQASNADHSLKICTKFLHLFLKRWTSDTLRTCIVCKVG